MKLPERPYLMLAFAYASAGRPQHARAQFQQIATIYVMRVRVTRC